MQLSETIFSDVASALGATAKGEDELRRRRAERFNVAGQSMIRPHGVVNAVPRQVTMIDISSMGVCIVDRLNLSSGNQFVLHLPRQGGGTLDVICTVRQSRLNPGGTFRIGAEFTSEADHSIRLVAGAQGVMVAHAAAKAPDLTAKAGTPAWIHLPGTGPEGLPHACDIHSASGATVTLNTACPLAAGNSFILEFPEGRHSARYWRCTVVHSRVMADDQVRLTAKLISPTSAPNRKPGLFARIRSRWSRAA